MWADRWLENRTDRTGLVRGVATMGSTLKLLLALLVIAAIVACGRMSDDTVRDRDKQRIETAKNMPGSDIPMDPADAR